MFPLSYCVNLDKRKDRWEKSLLEFSKIKFTPPRFSAIEHPIPAAGCRLSHLTILKEALDKNENVLIFEDDVKFINYGKSIINKALDELINLEWDMIYFGGNILKPFYQIMPHLAKLSHCQSTHAYGVNKKFLTLLVPWLEKNNFTIDVLYADGVIPFHRCYITVPMVAIQRQDYSNIEKKVMSYDVPVSRYNHFLIKKDFKKHEK